MVLGIEHSYERLVEADRRQRHQPRAVADTHLFRGHELAYERMVGWWTDHEPCVDGSELARAFFTFAALVGAAMCSAFRCGHMTAGHNALRGSGPGQNLAFDNALAHVGCPDRRIDRLCITRCSLLQPSH